jgi:hypothetical protein
MKNKCLLLAVLCASTPFLHAQSLSFAEADLDLLKITPRTEGATVFFKGPWLIKVSSTSGDQNATDTQTDGGTADSYSVSTGTFFVEGGADTSANPVSDPYGSVGGDAGLGEPALYAASGHSSATFSNTFQVNNEGEGQTIVDFCASIFTGAAALSVAPGYSASAFSSFALFVNGNEVPLLTYSVSQSSEGEQGEFVPQEYEGTLSDNLTLDYDTDYDISIVLYSEFNAFGDGSGAEPVPEASTLFATGAAFGLAALLRRRR